MTWRFFSFSKTLTVSLTAPDFRLKLNKGVMLSEQSIFAEMAKELNKIFKSQKNICISWNTRQIILIRIQFPTNAGKYDDSYFRSINHIHLRGLPKLALPRNWIQIFATNHPKIIKNYPALNMISWWIIILESASRDLCFLCFQPYLTNHAEIF